MKNKKVKKFKFTTEELSKLIEDLQTTTDRLSVMLHIKLVDEEKNEEKEKEKELKNRLKLLSKEDMLKELSEIVNNCLNYDTREFNKLLKVYKKAIKKSKNVVEEKEVSEIAN